MTMIITGVANTGGKIASLNRFARCSGWTRRLKEPLAPRDICRMVCPQKGRGVRRGFLRVGVLYRPDYPHSDGFFPGAPAMIQEGLMPLCPEGSIRWCW